MQKRIPALVGIIIIVAIVLVGVMYVFHFNGVYIYLDETYQSDGVYRHMSCFGICFKQSEDKNISTATNDWKTYTNTQYGFEIKYPNSFIGSVSEKAKLADVFFYGENSDKLDLEGSFNDNFNLNSLVSDNKDVSFQKSEILVDGVKSYKVDSTTCYMGCGSSYSVFIPYKNGAIIIGIGRGNGSEKDPSLVKITDKEKSSFDEIISTFKFTK